MLSDSSIRSLDIATGQRRARPRQTREQRREAWYRIGCFVAAGLLLSILGALVSAR